ncbi:MAG: O-antigen ligase C-terminal domain-containing protein [Betaproteobacteria bacterium]|nr:O-antigen ligase C-terminal domain-containing protein [Betaproteobacteria bacterium]
MLAALGLGLIWPWDPGPSAKTGSMFVAAWAWSLLALGAAWLRVRLRVGWATLMFAALAAVIGLQAISGLLAYPGQGWLAVVLLLGAAGVAALARGLAAKPRWIEVAAWALLLQALLQVVLGMAQFAMWQSPSGSRWLAGHAAWVFDLISYPGNGRVYGNLRQPNHYATAVALGYVGLAVLAPRGRALLAWLASAALAWALVVSGSRTGTVHVLVLALLVLLAWPRPWRDARMGALLAAPLLYLGWWAALHLANELGWVSYLSALSRQIDQPVNARSIIWRDAWEVFRMHPLRGWGWGQIGWGLEQTSVAGHLHPLPLENIDNAHDLLLQLLAETGVAGTLPPLALGLAWLWRVSGAWRRGASGADARRAVLAPLLGCAFLGLHSLVEYPLWYAYFLLDFAFLLGWAEGAAQPPAAAGPARAAPARPSARAPALLAAAAALALTAKAQIDYVRTSMIYAADDAGGVVLRRLAMREDWFFLPLAQFPEAAAILPAPGDDPARLLDELALLERSSHVWGDPQLLSRRMIVLLRLGREQEALDLARYTAHAFWLYAPQTARAFGPLAAAAGLAGNPGVARVLAVLHHAPVLRRVEVPRK